MTSLENDFTPRLFLNNQRTFPAMTAGSISFDYFQRSTVKKKSDYRISNLLNNYSAL